MTLSTPLTIVATSSSLARSAATKVSPGSEVVRLPDVAQHQPGIDALQQRARHGADAARGAGEQDAFHRVFSLRSSLRSYSCLDPSASLR